MADNQPTSQTATPSSTNGQAILRPSGDNAPCSSAARSTAPIRQRGFLTSTQAAIFLGISKRTLEAISQSELKYVRKNNGNGWKRYSVESLNSYMGIENEPQNKKGEIFAIGRVSTPSHRQSLENQCRDLIAFCKNEYGIEPYLYKYIGSGMSIQNPVFQRAMKDIMAGRWQGGKLIVSHFDRLSRGNFKFCKERTAYGIILRMACHIFLTQKMEYTK